MIGKTLSFITVAAAVVLSGGLYMSAHINQAQDLEITTVRSVVLGFGTRIKQVSVFAPNAKDEIQHAYKGYVTPELLNAWEASPVMAPGKITSSPWPDHIDISNITKVNNDYQIEGEVILMASDELNDGVAGSIPATMSVSYVDNQWLVSRFQSP